VTARREPWLAAAIAVCALASAAAAGEGSARTAIREARAHWNELDYELVVTAADAALAAGDATDELRVEALRLKGSALAVLGREQAAGEAFEALVALDPAYELPEGTSPRILEVFRPARARWLVAQERRLAMELGPSLAKLAVDVTVPRRARGGRPIAIEIEISDPDGVSDLVVVSYRKRDSRGYSTLTAAAQPGRLDLAIPGAFTASATDYRIELFVEVRHRSGIPIDRRGTAEKPYSIVVASGSVPSSPPITKRWWFWAGTAAAVAAAVAIPVLVDRGRDVGPQTIIGRRNF
jgi:hypothetical protein